MSNTHALKTPRGFSGKKPSGTSKAVYPPEESFNPEFIKEVEQSIQEVKDGKGSNTIHLKTCLPATRNDLLSSCNSKF